LGIIRTWSRRAMRRAIGSASRRSDAATTTLVSLAAKLSASCKNERGPSNRGNLRGQVTPRQKWVDEDTQQFVGATPQWSSIHDEE
jgi:hypothetical protein